MPWGFKTKNEAERAARTVRQFERNGRTETGKRRRYPLGGSGGCKKRNEVWKLKITGTPTGGSFDIDVTVNNVTETITIDYDASAADVKTAFATHSELESTDLDTSGDGFPGAEILVEFIGDYAKKRMFSTAGNAPAIDDSGLTGGTSPAAWVVFCQFGYPGNANV